ncbi:MAG: outer membrane beta-barrel protein [Bacteroidales bacterium]|nr:outer membrane beta-barrel protein [Bacteroidales bacterium]
MKAQVFCLIFITLLFASCSVPEQTTSPPTNKNNYTCWTIRTGVNTGGFVDNQETDAVSGATYAGYSFGLHPEICISGKTIETGIDLHEYGQTLTYSDPVNEFIGERALTYQELRLPLTYNFRFFKNLSNCDFFYLKIGLATGYLIHKNVDEEGLLPEYEMKKFSLGPTLGVSFSPFRISPGFTIGGFVDLYRGSKVYKDFYNNSRETGNTSCLTAGLLLKLGPGK